MGKVFVEGEDGREGRLKKGQYESQSRPVSVLKAIIRTCQVASYIPVCNPTIKMVAIVLLLIVPFCCVNGARIQRLKFGRDFGASELGNIKAGGSRFTRHQNNVALSHFCRPFFCIRRPSDICFVIASYTLLNCITSRRAFVDAPHRSVCYPGKETRCLVNATRLIQRSYNIAFHRIQLQPYCTIWNSRSLHPYIHPPTLVCADE